MERFDVVVIGAGPGGYPAAIRAAQLGASVAIVERERLGGTCLNFGCIPTKALIASADAYHRLGDMKSLGVSVERATLDYAAMIERKDKVVGQLRDGVAQLLTANGVRQFAGAAAFRDRETIAIDGGPRRSARRRRSSPPARRRRRPTSCPGTSGSSKAGRSSRSAACRSA